MEGERQRECGEDAEDGGERESRGMRQRGKRKTKRNRQRRGR